MIALDGWRWQMDRCLSAFHFDLLTLSLSTFRKTTMDINYHKFIDLGIKTL
jgi:hypothetical protein